MRFMVFGLGAFGSALAIQLIELGHEVIAVDRKMELTDKYKHSITHTIALDSTNKDAVAQLPLRDIDAAIVGIGEDEGAIIMTTALLKQMNVKRIICRVTSPLQKIVLEAMNIQEFVYPEASSAERLALKLDLPGVIESFQIASNYRLLEVAVPDRYIGTRVNELNLETRYRLLLVTIIESVVQKSIFGSTKNEMKVKGIVPPDTVLKQGDILLLFGAPNDLESFIEG
jgi:trk system potassium uptake protein TrkA